MLRLPCGYLYYEGRLTWLPSPWLPEQVLLHLAADNATLSSCDALCLCPDAAEARPIPSRPMPRSAPWSALAPIAYAAACRAALRPGAHCAKPKLATRGGRHRAGDLVLRHQIVVRDAGRLVRRHLLLGVPAAVAP